MPVDIQFVPAGINPQADTIWGLIRSGPWRPAISVGFVTIDYVRRDDGDGYLYTKVDLLVKFTRSCSETKLFEQNRIPGRFNAGEVAGFTREQADRLFDLGVAERFQPIVEPEPQQAA